MARHGLVGLFVAAGLVLATYVAGGLVPDPNDPVAASAGRESYVTILATVVTFFAVATLAVSVSLTLLSTAAGRNESDLMAVLVDDRERDFLLQTIFVSFLVSLANLCLLALVGMNPLAALALPAVLAIVTLLLMVGYIIERVRLFDDLGLANHVLRRLKSKTAILSRLSEDEGHLKIEQKRNISQDLLRLDAIVRRLIKEGRRRDAHKAFEISLEGLANLIAAQADPRFVLPTSRELHDGAYQIDTAHLRAIESSGVLEEWSGSDKHRIREKPLASWWLTETVAFASLLGTALDAFVNKDADLAARYLKWIDQVWLQRLVFPALHQGARIDEGRETLRKQTLTSLEKFVEACRTLYMDDLPTEDLSRFALVKTDVGNLGVDLAASYLDTVSLDEDVWKRPRPVSLPGTGEIRYEHDRALLLVERPILMLTEFMEMFGEDNWESSLAEALRPSVAEYIVNETLKLDDMGREAHQRSYKFAVKVRGYLDLGEQIQDPYASQFRFDVLAGWHSLSALQRQEVRDRAGTTCRVVIERLDAVVSESRSAESPIAELSRHAKRRDWAEVRRREMRFVLSLIERVRFDDDSYRPEDSRSASLHEAMVEALGRTDDGCLPASKLADVILSEGLYDQHGLRPDRSTEVYAMASNHPKLFEARAGVICLKPGARGEVT